MRGAAVTATAWGPPSARAAETGAERAQLSVGDIVREARARIGEQAPVPGAAHGGRTRAMVPAPTSPRLVSDAAGRARFVTDRLHAAAAPASVALAALTVQRDQIAPATSHRGRDATEDNDHRDYSDSSPARGHRLCACSDIGSPPDMYPQVGTVGVGVDAIGGGPLRQ
ncbi:MAG TPA: DUF1490 family protein [Pseudonocardiaceae bacterium]|nr:DUF1490 family protein [Pseudonocardiaceae bacterium]